MVERIDASEVVRASRRVLALRDSAEVHDPALLSSLLRRAASYLCPCSTGTLVRSVVDGLRGLTNNREQLVLEVGDAVEKAMLAGDLLELSQVTTDDPNVKGTWVFPAPPAFVVRPSGSVFVMGVSLDEPNALPAMLSARIDYSGHFRLLRAQEGESLPEVLRELGLLELSEQSWFRPPRQEAASAMAATFERELSALGPSGQVSGLTILDGSQSPTYYRGRWTMPKQQTGYYVARRPQAYGADIWGFALLKDGVLQKFLDFPRRLDRWRGSDIAWHLQMALDHRNGTPQRYRLRKHSNEMIIDFFSPLPVWAERRLAVIGRPAVRDRCLFSYQLADEELAAEETFLKSSLWLAPATSEGIS